MLGFTPFKRHPNKFNYIPRYYDPEKEAREERRAELRGERVGGDAREYRPGQYIRTQREARAARKERQETHGRNRIWVMMAGAVLVLLFIYLLYPRLADLFLRMSGAAPAPATVEQTLPAQPRSGTDQEGISDVEWQEMPITVVPNDYQEE